MHVMYAFGNLVFFSKVLHQPSFVLNFLLNYAKGTKTVGAIHNYDRYMPRIEFVLLDLYHISYLISNIIELDQRNIFWWVNDYRIFFVVGDFYCFWFPAKMRLQKMTMAIFSQGNFVISDFDFAYILKYQCIFFNPLGKYF